MEGSVDRRTFTMGLGALVGLLSLDHHPALAAPLLSSETQGQASPDEVLKLVDPELREAARQVIRYPFPVEGKFDINLLLRGRAVMTPKPPLAAPEVRKKVVPGSPGQPDVTLYIVNPSAGEPRPVIVHTHGGGFVVGSAAGDLTSLQSQALALNCVIVTVDYRLPPEAPFPKPLDDFYAGLIWTYKNCATFGGDRTRIAVQGGSAGGGLAAMLALMARDRGEVPLVHQSLIYPMLDDRTGAKLLPFPIGRFAWTGPVNQAAWTAFLGQPAGGNTVPKGSVPARAENLKGLPDTFIGVGAIDLFVLEDIEYGRRLIEAAVSARIEVVPGAFHGFDGAAPRSNVAKRFRNAQYTALARAFGTPFSESSDDSQQSPHPAAG